MRRRTVLLCAAVSAGCCLAAAKGPWIRGTTDKDPVSYRAGEAMVFSLTLEQAENLPSGLEICWTRTGDDGIEAKGKAPASPGRPVEIKTSLDRPGFVRIYALLRNPDGTVWVPKGGEARKDRSGGYKGAVFFDGGAGADVDAIRQGAPEPGDFDAFWAKHRTALAAVPMDGVACKELPSRNPAVKIFSVTIPCAGPKPSTGYLIVPAKEGKYPAEAMFYGYGTSWTRRATEAPDGSRESGKIMKLLLSAHGFELNREPAYYKAEREKVKSNGYGHAFDPEQNSDPEKAYFCGMTYRVMRGIEYLKSRPEWNGKDLVMVGTSQGGLQSIWGAALVPGVTEAKVTVPWGCDIAGPSVGRNHGEWFLKWVPALGYYDTANMAKRIPKTCKVTVVRAGLGDYTCPPSGVAAFYNNLSCPKDIVWVQGSTHGYVPPKR